MRRVHRPFFDHLLGNPVLPLLDKVFCEYKHPVDGCWTAHVGRDDVPLPDVQLDARQQRCAQCEDSSL